MFRSNLQRIIENDIDVDDIEFETRFGVFLCIPDENDKFRLALLWRKETVTLRDASMEFGKILYAIPLTAYLHNYCNVNVDTIRYQCLGPNSCRIGDLVRWTYFSCFQLVTN
jgi:hypothetical protein